MYDDYKKKGIRHTIISFDPFLNREDVRELSDARVAKNFGLTTQTVKAMRRHMDVPFETIQILCHKLECQPGDILKASTMYIIPAKNETED